MGIQSLYMDWAAVVVTQKNQGTVDLGFIDLDKIADSGQCFRWEKTGDHEYVIPSAGKVLKARQVVPGVIDVDCSESEWDGYWAEYFDVDTDYDSIIASIDPEDRYLIRAAYAARGIRILKQEPWETVASFIISQNNNIPRIKSCIGRLCEAFGGFPSAMDISRCNPKIIAGLGLGYRDAYLWWAGIQYVADRCDRLNSSDRMTYAERRAYFQTYKGIGAKVSDCICLYGFGHKEAFPVDVWMKRILAEHYAGSFPVERYQGYAGVLQQFMFYYERQEASKRSFNGLKRQPLAAM